MRAALAAALALWPLALSAAMPLDALEYAPDTVGSHSTGSSHLHASEERVMNALGKTQFLLVIALVAYIVVPAAHAATFTVNSTFDGVDATPGNGKCATAGSTCTLRAAIMEANVLAGGPHTIVLPANPYT